MGTNEKFLNSQFGNKRPFKVPDGYFECLTSQIVDNLPEKSLDGSAIKLSKPSVWRVWRYITVAACICGVIFGVTAYLYNAPKGIEHTLHSSVTDDTYYDVVDYVTDYGMMDNDDIYALLSEN